MFYVLASCLAVLGAATCILFPRLSLAGIIFLLFVNAPIFLAIAFDISAVTEVALLGLIVIIIRDLYVERDLPVMLVPVLAVCLLYLNSILVGWFVAPHPDLVISGTAELAKEMLLPVLLVATLRTHDRIMGAFAGIAAATAALSFIAVAQWMSGADLSARFGFDFTRDAQAEGEIGALRYQSLIGESNYFALILVTAIPVLVPFYILFRSPLLRIIAIAVIVSVLISLYLTASRGALIGLAVVIAFAARKQVTLLMLLPVLFVAVGIAAYEYLPAGYVERYEILAQDTVRLFHGASYFQDKSISGRVSEMAVGLIHFVENPWFGVGYNQFESLYQDTARLNGLMARGADRQAHSLYVEILAERGIFGAMVFMLLVTFAVSSAIFGKAALDRDGNISLGWFAAMLPLSFVGYLATSLFLHEAYPRYFWILFALACAMPQSSNTQNNRITGETRNVCE
ncbi:O-antigen ligase family protein [Silicimonas sp. MF1-12-2]|uniref:O-antigen ligase family protein n=1 Tax=Silicimonas sp. MF1-12-2 TaxID=3384793 RepID=UPI0039B6A883